MLSTYVLFKSSKLPSAEEWQKALHDAGFNLDLEPTLDIKIKRGFLQSKYEGKNTGFEFTLGKVDDLIKTYPQLKDRISTQDMTADFDWSPDAREMLAVLIASAILAKLTDGLVFDPQDNAVATAEEAIKLADNIILETKTSLDTLPEKY